MDNFEFVKATHTYLLNGEKIPSVSEIIAPLNSFETMPLDVLANAQRYGTSVHDTIAYWLKGELDEDSLDSGLVKPLEAFKSWYKLAKKIYGEPVASELPMYHKTLKYGGTPDLVFDEAIVDYKTRPFSKITDTVQLAAYSHLVPEIPKKRLIVLELRTDGTYRVIDAKCRHAYAMFRELLKHYYAERELNTLIKNWRERT